MLKLIKKSNQAGVTLLETILVLSLIAIIMIGGLNLYGNASSSSKAIEAQRQIVSLATNVQSLYSSQGGYGSGTIDVGMLDDAGAVPGGMLGGSDATPTLVNTFGGEITVTGNGGLLEILYKDVPQNVCIKLVTGDMGAQTVEVSSTEVDLPLTPLEAVGACEPNTDGDINLNLSF